MKEKDIHSERISLKIFFQTIYGYFLLLNIMLFILALFPLLIIIAVFDKNKRFSSLVLHCASKVFQTLFIGFSVEKRGEKVIPPCKGEKRIYIANHCSRIDGVLFCNIPGTIKTIMKESDAKIPVIGWLIALSGHILASRDATVAGKSKLYSDITSGIERGDSLLIFPEGTRSKDGRIGPFHHGGFKIALKVKADIYPVLFDTWNVIRPGSPFIRNMKPVITFLPPLKYENIKHMSHIKLSHAVRNMLENSLAGTDNSQS